MSLNVEQHFRPDEKPIIDDISDWISQAVLQYRPVLSIFLNPRQIYIAQNLVNQQDEVRMRSYGGFEEAEMQRVLIYPSYFEPSNDDFELQLLEINYPEKFAEISHRQVLGTLFNQGVERGTFGDIITDGTGRWQIIVQKQMASYFQEQVDRVGKLNIRLEPVEMTDTVNSETDWESIETTVSSVRVDSIIAAAFNFSRNRAKEVIEKGYAQVNWAETQKPDYLIVEHDLLSVRRAGRIRVDEISSQPTKKCKVRIKLSVVTVN